MRRSARNVATNTTRRATPTQTPVPSGRWAAAGEASAADGRGVARTLAACTHVPAAFERLSSDDRPPGWAPDVSPAAGGSPEEGGGEGGAERGGRAGSEGAGP